MLYLVYAVLGVCCTLCQFMIMIWRDGEGWLNFVFCDDGRVMDDKERYGGWRWERCGGYERIFQISGTTWLIGLGRPRIGEITRRIGTRTCHTGDGKLTHTPNSLKSQFLIMICPTFSLLSPSLPQLYRHFRTQSYIIPLYLSMPLIKSYHRVQHTLSTAYTRYRIHCMQHTLSTAYTEYCIHRVLHTPHTASSQDRLSPAPSQSLSSQWSLLYSILYIPTITS